MYNSVARNNYVHDETQCIFVSESHNNQVYDNTVSDCKNWIYLKAGSSNNKIYHNTIINATLNGILVNTGASDNTFTSNTIINATELGINVDEDAEDSANNTFENNKLINSRVAGQEEEEQRWEDDWHSLPDFYLFIISFIIQSIQSSYGTKMSSKVPKDKLKKIFTMLLIVVAIYIIIKSMSF